MPGARESVLDYPRPPLVQELSERVRVEHAGKTIADSTRALRVLETGHPPTIYIPRTDLELAAFMPAEQGDQTVCEWKGVADYYDVVVAGERAPRAAWYYAEPVERYDVLADHVAIYAGRVDACWLGDERVVAEQSDFYGGWITSAIDLADRPAH
jgi:uncharacterized protein (DUF427 family)